MAQTNKGIDFSMQLPQGADPSSANGALLVNAAATEASGKVAGAKGTATLVGQVAGAAIDAAHGYLESGVESAVKDTTEYLRKSNIAAEGLDILGSPMSTPADRAKAEADISSVKDALNQGVITRSQALLQIDAKVKEYSNMLPGYASNLRQLATKLTGTEHMGMYAEYTLLNKQSAAEKAREDARKHQSELVSGFIKEYNRMPTGQADLQMYAALGATQAEAKRLDAVSKSQNLGLAEREKAVIDMVQKHLAGGMLQLSLQISGLFGAKDPQGKDIPPENMAIVKGKIISNINTFYDQVEASLLSVPSSAISPETKQKQLSDLRTQRESMVKGLSNQDNYDVFMATAKITKTRAEDVINSYAAANAGLAIMRWSGVVLPDSVARYMQAKQTSRAEAAYAKQFPGLYEYMEKAFKGGSGGGGGSLPGDDLGQNLSQIGQNSRHLSSIKAVNPPMHSMAMTTLASTLEEIGNKGFGVDPETQVKRKSNVANWLEAFAMEASGNDLSISRKFLDIVSGNKGNFIGKMTELDPQNKTKAFNTMLGKTRDILETQGTGMFDRLSREMSEQANQFWQPTEMKLAVNPTTKQFELKIKPTSGEWVSSDGRGLAGGKIRELLTSINKGMGILENLGDVGQLPKELMTEDRATLFLNRFNSGFFSLSFAERAQAIERAGGTVLEKALRLDKPIPTSELIK